MGSSDEKEKLMKRKIRPAEEEIGNIAFIVLFVILWYSGLLGTIAAGGIRVTVLLFLVAGLLPVYSAVTMVRRALFYRKQRADAIAYGQSQPGRIQGVVRQDVPYYSGKNRTLRYHRYYYLKVDITDPVTGVTNTIQSQGYRKPIHRYLASEQVRVYTDRSGWKYYLEDFRFKERMSDPGIFDGRPLEFEETAAGSGRVVQIIFIIVFILILVSMFMEGGAL